MLAAATPVMREAAKTGRAPGRIVNIVSTAGLYGNFGQAAYAAAKAGLVGLTRVVAMDMARSKVNCNAVAPFAATRVTESIQPGERRAGRLQGARADGARGLRGAAGGVSVRAGLRGHRTGVRCARARGLSVFAAAAGRAHRHPAALPELTPEALDAAISIQMREQFVDLATDLEAFNSEPLL